MLDVSVDPGRRCIPVACAASGKLKGLHHHLVGPVESDQLVCLILLHAGCPATVEHADGLSALVLVLADVVTNNTLNTLGVFSCLYDHGDVSTGTARHPWPCDPDPLAAGGRQAVLRFRRCRPDHAAPLGLIEQLVVGPAGLLHGPADGRGVVEVFAPAVDRLRQAVRRGRGGTQAVEPRGGQGGGGGEEQGESEGHCDQCEKPPASGLRPPVD